MTPLDPGKKEFIQFMMDCEVLQFGEFKTKSGRLSPYFINTGNYNTGNELNTLGEFYARAIHKNFTGVVTNLFGPAYKGIPIGTSTAGALYRNFSLDISLSFNRKEAKDHGEGGWLLGYDYGKSDTLQKVVIVEDVTTAGTSIRENLPRINQYPHVEVIGLVVSVDRMEKGSSGLPALKELAKEYNIKTVSLINFNDLVEFLEVADLPQKEETLSRMRDYWQKYGSVTSDP